MNYKNVLRKEKGITLVALIITVILMLILAGVAISVLTEDGGLFGKAKNSAELYERAAEEEDKTISNLINEIDKYLTDTNPVVKPPAVIEEKVAVNQTFDGRLKGTYNNPIIPRGFAPINENGALWGSEDGYKKGLVIEDVNQNQFVWVPVDGTIVKFERKNWGSNYNQSSRAFSSYRDPDGLTTTISKNTIENGGFYIGRYETGVEGTDTLVIKQGVTPWVSITWDNAKDYTNQKYSSTDETYGASSTLIYGTHWDTALSFIEAYDIGEAGYKNYSTATTGVGNFLGEDDGYSEMAPTGAEDAFKQKNIYDMAGNVWEWTRELYGTERVRRGGSYGATTESPACARYSNAPDTSGGARGFRIILLIKES